MVRFIPPNGLAAAIVCVTAGSEAVDATTDPAAIRRVLMVTCDRPEARPVVDLWVAVGDHAVAGRAQVEWGRRALPLRHGTEWHITPCAGDGLKQVEQLREAGESLPHSHALGRFATINGVVRVNANGQHCRTHQL